MSSLLAGTLGVVPTINTSELFASLMRFPGLGRAMSSCKPN